MLVAPVAKYCLLRGRISEGCQYMDAVLSLASLTTADEFVQVMILAGELHEQGDDLEQAQDRFETAFTLATPPVCPSVGSARVCRKADWGGSICS